VSKKRAPRIIKRVRLEIEYDRQVEPRVVRTIVFSDEVDMRRNDPPRPVPQEAIDKLVSWLNDEHDEEKWLKENKEVAR
jgi:hypothetical protein